MKINRMPTTILLLVFSWLIAIFGFLGAGFLIIFRFGEFNSLIIGFSILLGSLLLAAVIRMFGNIGQMFFDLKGFLFSDLQSLSQGFATLSQDLKDQLQSQTTALTQGLKGLNHSLSDDLQTLTQGFATLSQDLKDQLQSQTTALTQGLKELNHSLSDDLQTLKNSFEQMSCDSKDISQNIHQITTFFEQIERHLDLKK